VAAGSVCSFDVQAPTARAPRPERDACSVGRPDRARVLLARVERESLQPLLVRVERPDVATRGVATIAFVHIHGEPRTARGEIDARDGARSGLGYWSPASIDPNQGPL